MDFDALSDDSEIAFHELAVGLRSNRDAALRDAETEDSKDSIRRSFMDRIERAAKVLEIEEVDTWGEWHSKTDIEDRCDALDDLLDGVAFQLKLERRFACEAYSVELDENAKSELREHLDRIESIVDHLEVSDRKREALIRKISALRDEIGRRRTRFEIVGAFLIDGAAVGGEVAKRLKPVMELFGKAKQAEDNNTALPEPELPKQIEAPRKQIKNPEDHVDNEGTA